MIQTRKKFLLYWHNGRGLGHTSRTAKIAEGILCEFDFPSIAGITGASKGLNLLPSNVDIIKLPSFTSVDGKFGAIVTPKLAIPYKDLFEMRKVLIDTFVRLYCPDLIFVDFHPYGKEGEIMKSLSKKTSINVLGLRSVLKGHDNTNSEFFSKEVSCFVQKYYDAIHVFSDPNLLQIDEFYKIPSYLVKKIKYTGYVSNIFEGTKEVAKRILDLSEKKTIVINFGGGSIVTKNWKSLFYVLKKADFLFDKAYVMVGPYMSLGNRREIELLIGDSRKIILCDWKINFSIWMKACDLFIGAAGYNTIADILGNEVNSLLVSNQISESEQFLHMKKLETLGKIRVLNMSSSFQEIQSQIQEALEFPLTSIFSDVWVNGKINNARLIKNLLDR